LILRFGGDNFHKICDALAGKDRSLGKVLTNYGYPPMWSRPANFQTLVHIILEQQVSLASALAALNKLQEKIRVINPENLLQLNERDMKSCYFSRQKTSYVQELAKTIRLGGINLDQLALDPDEKIRTTLKKVKGIGDWTVDIYLLMALQRADIFPLGDLAMVNSLKKLKQLPLDISKTDLLGIAEKWRPWRSIGTMILWHHYLEEKKQRKKTTLTDSSLK
jgi:DNA-3-methyladenine glycosylase II